MAHRPALTRCGARPWTELCELLFGACQVQQLTELLAAAQGQLDEVSCSWIITFADSHQI